MPAAGHLPPFVGFGPQRFPALAAGRSSTILAAGRSSIMLAATRWTSFSKISSSQQSSNMAGQAPRRGGRGEEAQR